jgi:hypothetical protein
MRNQWPNLLNDWKVPEPPLGKRVFDMPVIVDSSIPEGCVDMIDSAGKRHRFRISSGEEVPLND